MPARWHLAGEQNLNHVHNARSSNPPHPTTHLAFWTKKKRNWEIAWRACTACATLDETIRLCSVGVRLLAAVALRPAFFKSRFRSALKVLETSIVLWWPVGCRPCRGVGCGAACWSQWQCSVLVAPAITLRSALWRAWIAAMVSEESLVFAGSAWLTLLLVASPCRRDQHE